MSSWKFGLSADSNRSEETRHGLCTVLAQRKTISGNLAHSRQPNEHKSNPGITHQEFTGLEC